MKTQKEEATIASVLPTTIVTISISGQGAGQDTIEVLDPATFKFISRTFKKSQSEKTLILLHDLKKDPFKKMESLLSRYVKWYCDDKTATFEFKEIKPGYGLILDNGVGSSKGTMEIQATVVVNYQYEGPPENISVESSFYKNNLAWIGAKLEEVWKDDPEPEILSIKKGLTLLYLRD